MPIDVKWFTSEMRGAPVINGNTPGCYINLLDTLLLPTGGFGLSTALSVTVADGIATATLNAGQTFLPHAVVAVSGATPAALNGEARVLTSSSTSITFATSAADGPATGTIVIKYAPVGHWEKVYQKTKTAVYQSTHPLSNGHCVRVDDTGNTFARVRAYEGMTDVDTGVGPYPADAQMSGGGYWHKAPAASASVIRWKLFADGVVFYPSIAFYTGSNATYLASPLGGFGEPVSLRPSGDGYGCFLGVRGANPAAAAGGLEGGVTSNLNNGAIFAPRAVSGVGSSQVLESRTYCGDSIAISGADATLGPFPSEVDGQLKLSKRYLRQQGATAPRAEIPGVRYIPQSGAATYLSDGDIVSGAGDLSGRKLMVVAASSSLVSAPNGAYVVDITGPWR